MNVKLKMFICEECQDGHHRKNIETHLRNKHEVVLLNNEHIELGELADSFQALDSYPSFKADRIYDEFSGIRVQKNIHGCPICYFNATHLRTVKEHIKKEHSECKLSAILVSGQVINSGATKTILRIKSKKVGKTRNNTHSSSEKLLDTLQQFDWKKIPHPIPNTRQISPFLLRTQWHLHVQPYDNETLRALVAPVGQDEHVAVCTAIKEYFAQCIDFLDQGKTHNSVLEILNTPEPNQ